MRGRGARGAGTHRTDSFPSLTDVYWAGFWEKARLHQTGPEGLEPDCGLRRRLWPCKLGLVNWEVSAK